MLISTTNNPVTIKEIALIAPLVVTFTWCIPLIFSKSRVENSKKWLGFFLLNIFIFFFATGSIYFASSKVFIFCDPLFMFSLLSIFPILFFYVHTLAGSTFEKKEIAAHFFPAGLFLIAAAVVYLFFMDNDARFYYADEFLTGKGDIISAIIPIEIINILSKVIFALQAIGYFYFIRKTIVRYKEKISSYHSNLELLNIKWIKLFYVIYCTAVAIGIPSLMGGHESISSNKGIILVGMLILTLIFYFIAWIGYTQRPELPHANNNEPKGIDISESDIEKLKNNLLLLFDAKKPYLNPELKIHDVYLELNTNRTYLSRLVNSEFDTNFCMFVNKYRVDEAKRLFTNPGSYKYKTTEIGQQAGFKSYNSFVQAFRLFENSTPSKFRKKIAALN